MTGFNIDIALSKTRCTKRTLYKSGQNYELHATQYEQNGHIISALTVISVCHQTCGFLKLDNIAMTNFDNPDNIDFFKAAEQDIKTFLKSVWPDVKYMQTQNRNAHESDYILKSLGLKPVDFS